MSTQTFLIKLLARKQSQERGFTIVLALSMGLILMAIATTLIFRASRNEAIASTRTQTGDSLAVAEGGIARIIALMTKPENAVLLTRNYDPIDPKTGKNYLGADGIPKTSDDTTTAINEWITPITFPCLPSVSPNVTALTSSNSIGNGQFQLLAYRYDSLKQTGTFLISGQNDNSIAYLAVTVAISATIQNFPGAISTHTTIDPDRIEIQARKIVGKNANIYFDPVTAFDNSNLSGYAIKGGANRSQYLAAIGSALDTTDTSIDGTIFACKLQLNFPFTAQGTDLGQITEASFPTVTPPAIPTLLLTGASGQITHYQTNKIDITDKIIDVDTTAGPVYLYVKGSYSGKEGFHLRGNSKIRNIRTDGQLPRVGDLRIIIVYSGLGTPQSAYLYNTACIQNAFLYNRDADFKLETSGDGCESPGNSNFDGVVWAEDIQNTDVSLAGINVPDNLLSLSDLANSFNLYTINKIGSIQKWQRYKL
ncbi:hypothetical protein [Scytonema millei]|uniref:Uncharacterized protein n=1 Tax=Scytonema millei VB511283 TaxID=1245923 RepID=A0A9X5I5F0_9CYAN|nr:hypothetical protein [Scytonema millei]NHC36553.1 hypothetical protein [Scytonema millei VB511283]